jgi:anti-sigma regulatory factor (Ser/Thr protein kinase)
MSQESTIKQHGESLQRSITLPNDIATISQLSEFVETVCEEKGLDMALTMNLNLALEEAVVNVMSYAYPDSQGDVKVDIMIDDQKVVSILTDSGIPFDPTQKGDVDTTLPAEERPIGGLGIHLVKQIMDKVSYQYVGNQNILTLEKNIK